MLTQLSFPLYHSHQYHYYKVRSSKSAYVTFGRGTGRWVLNDDNKGIVHLPSSTMPCPLAAISLPAVTTCKPQPDTSYWQQKVESHRANSATHFPKLTQPSSYNYNKITN